MRSALDAYQQRTQFTPNPMQEEFFTHIAPEKANPALLLKAPTGSGKTEAVLIPSLEAQRRLFLIFPSRSLVEDQIDRCEKYLCRASENGKKSYALVVDTGAQASRTIFRDGEPLEKGTRHLYDGDVIVTTFDKFLYRFFGFGEPKKSYIYPFRIHHSQRRNLFCFDEVHAYDGVAFVNFERLIKALYKVNLDLVVMTATMPDAYQKALDFLDTVDYSEGAKRQELERYQKRRFPDKTVRRIPANTKEGLDEICAYVSQRYEPDKRTIVTIETIHELVPVYQFIKEQNSADDVFLYHGRLTNRQRQKVYRNLKALEAEDKGYLLFTTSAIEVGCDLNAHLLITELCNPDQLIQRAGRCNRKGEIPDAQIVVVGNKIRPFLSTLTAEGEKAYLCILQKQSKDKFNPSEILGIMKYEPHSDYRAEVLFDMLYEYVYEARLENKPLHDRGLVITRSFEPSLTLTTKIPESPNEYPENAVSVSIRNCINCIANGQDEELNSDLMVYHRFYDKFHEEFRFVPLNRFGGSVYFKELFIEVPAGDFCEELGYVEPPRVFESRGARGYRQNFVYKTTDENGESKEIWLHYLKDLDKPSPEDALVLPQSEEVRTKPVAPAGPIPEGKEQLTLFES